MKCVNCANCIGYENGVYFCQSLFSDGIEAVEECVANDDNMTCDMYVEDCNDDSTEKS